MAWRIEESKEIIKEIFQLCEGFEVAVCGGVAVAYWHGGRVPTSREIDLLVMQEDYEEVRDLFRSAGFKVSAYGHAGIGSSRVTGKGWDVDLLEASEEWGRDAIYFAKKIALDGVEVRIVRPEWLIVMKLVAMREKDVNDIALLAGVVDAGKVRRLVARYLGEDAVEDFDAIVGVGRQALKFATFRW